MKFDLSKLLRPKLDGMSPASRMGVFWLIVVMLVPMTLFYLQTINTGREITQAEARRVAEFFIAEAEDKLSEAERVMDGYLVEKRGSCRSSDLVHLSRFLATGDAVKAMGVIAPDGKVACTVGRLELGGLQFPVASNRFETKPSFGELKIKGHSAPLLIKQGNNQLRVFSVMATSRFGDILLPDHIVDFSQIDIVLPRGGIWYTLTGNAISKGFSEKTYAIELVSSRFPISINLLMDERAATNWGGSLRTSLLLLIGFCIGVLLVIWGVVFVISKYRGYLTKRFNLRIARNANDMFKITYQPIIDLKTNYLVGAAARFDLSLFDKVPEHRPSEAEILATIWKEIGKFASQRRCFYILVEFEGERTLQFDTRSALMEELRRAEYENFIVQLNWPQGKSSDPSLYLPLEELSAAGSMLAIECSKIQFSLMSDMWSWPYHRLVIDFEKLPDADDAIIWATEIVVDMAEQLQVETIAMGLRDKQAVDLAIGTGFKVGCGEEIGPPLPVDVFLSVVRPVPGTEQEAA